MGNQRMVVSFPAAPWMKTFLEGFGETISIAIGLSGPGAVGLRGEAVGSWGIWKHKNVEP